MLPVARIDVYHPEASVAGIALEKICLIGRATEYTLARVPLYHRAVGRPIHIVLPADIRLHLLHVTSLDTAELRQLDDPATQSLLHAGLALHRYKAVAEPLAAHYIK